MKKLIILSGPSCVGKGPLLSALKEKHPEIEFAQPLRLLSRRPRLKSALGKYELHGVDCYFFPKSFFVSLDRTRFVVGENRSQMQALDLEELKGLLEQRGLVITELFHTLAVQLSDWARTHIKGEDLIVRSVFVLPLEEKEIRQRMKHRAIGREEVLYEEIKHKLLRRGEDSPHAIEERARSAPIEIASASMFDYRIVNHAGEGAREEWGTPLGPEASRVLGEFVEIVTKSEP